MGFVFSSSASQSLGSVGGLSSSSSPGLVKGLAAGLATGLAAWLAAWTGRVTRSVVVGSAWLYGLVLWILQAVRIHDHLRCTCQEGVIVCIEIPACYNNKSTGFQLLVNQVIQVVRLHYISKVLYQDSGGGCVNCVRVRPSSQELLTELL